ncbi:MAG: SDR family oxidoreductase [Bacteroidales bacterium]|nr:SDR family oxidoreductase [Bacteroidales bacterium]
MKKIMILGSAGMLGHMVYFYLKSLNKYTIVDASFPGKLHSESKLLDVTDDKEVEQYILNEKPDIVINCIGILIQGSESDPSNAIRLNSYLPHRLAKILRQSNGKLIHISTDCVFSGKKGGYTENDFRDADDIYGRSKALGEVINQTDVTLRTSIIGPELHGKGVGLFHWFMQQEGEINGFTQMIWGGVTTLELAKVIDATIEQNIRGLIHVTNGNPISKYKILLSLKDIFAKKNIIINQVEGKAVDKSLKTIRSDLNFNYRSYNDMFVELYEWMEKNDKLYMQYF